MATRYEVAIAAPLIRELRRRLAGARLADSWPYQDWEQGPPSTYLRDFLGEWIEHDWATSQAQLTALPNFTARVGGVLIHFLWFRSPREGAIPLVMAHGWPSSPLEFAAVGQFLSEPDHAGPDDPVFEQKW